MTEPTPAPPTWKKLHVRIAYWQQYVWFYLWKWSMPWPWLHARTIRPVNEARQIYLEVHRAFWPKDRADD